MLKNIAQLVTQSIFIEADSDRLNAFSLTEPNSNPAVSLDIYNHRIRHYRILARTSSSPAHVVQHHKRLEIISEALKRQTGLNLPLVEDET
jgi:hypothetical protein